MTIGNPQLKILSDNEVKTMRIAYRYVAEGTFAFPNANFLVLINKLGRELGWTYKDILDEVVHRNDLEDAKSKRPPV